MSLTFYLTGRCPIKAYITNERNPISGYFGGLYFDSGYLTSYNLNCQPNAPVIADATIRFFCGMSGEFVRQFNRATGTKILNYCDATIIDPSVGNIGTISGVSNVQFSFQSEISPLYFAGEQQPNSIIFGKKELMASILVDNYSGDLPITGKSAGIKVNFNHPEIPSLSESFCVSGILFRREFETSVGNMIRSKLYIKQAFAENAPAISSVSSLTPAPGDSLTINGNNLSNATLVYFADMPAEVLTSSLTQLTVKVPTDIVSGSISVVTPGGVAQAAGLFSPTYSALTVDRLVTMSGNVSGDAYISGSNFYRVTDVRFSTTAPGLWTGSSGFRVVSSDIIVAPIPLDAAWGPVLVMATGRGVSGQSTERFVPIPTFYGYYPPSGISGSTIVISGQGFSGVTGVLFNNLPSISPFTATHSVVGNTGITVTVPTGNIRGVIKILAQSGISVTSLNTFLPVVNLTGMQPQSGRTGTAITLLGHNMFPDLMYSLGNNSYAVTFQNGVTGVFFRTQFVNPNFTGLTGLIPYNAQSGIVGINYNAASTYPSNAIFKLIHEGPTILGVYPKSGAPSGYITITGTNFYDVSAVKISGIGTINTISSYTASMLADSVSFRIPVNTPKITGDIYTVIVETHIGANVTGNALLTVLDSPIFSGYTGLVLGASGASGAFGDRVLVSGKNIYPGSQIFMPFTGLSGESGRAVVDSGSFNSTNSQLIFYVPQTARTGLSNIILYNGVDYASGINFKLINRPTISGIEHWSLRSGEWATGIVISGNWLSNVTGVQFGTGLNANFSFVTDTGINITIPEESETDYVTLLSRAGSTTSTGKFISMVPLVTFSSFSPQSAYSGETISLVGTRFNTIDTIYFTGANQTSQVGFDYRYFTKVSDVSITMPTPGGIGSGQITLRNSRGLVTSTQFFEPGQVPQILNINPPYGVHNETISLSGVNLSGVTAVFFQSPNSGRFVRGLNQSNVGLTGISIKVPHEITIGNVLISGSGRMWGTSSQTFYPIPSISGFSPTSVSSGNTIVVTGINATMVNSNILFVTGNHKLWNAFSGSTTIDVTNASGSNIVAQETGMTKITFTLDSEIIATGRIFLVNQFFTGITNTSNFLTSDIHGSLSNMLSTQALSITETAPVI